MSFPEINLYMLHESLHLTLTKTKRKKRKTALLILNSVMEMQCLRLTVPLHCAFESVTSTMSIVYIHQHICTGWKCHICPWTRCRPCTILLLCCLLSSSRAGSNKQTAQQQLSDFPKSKVSVFSCLKLARAWVALQYFTALEGKEVNGPHLLSPSYEEGSIYMPCNFTTGYF